jgi:hypothetical protein
MVQVTILRCKVVAGSCSSNQNASGTIDAELASSSLYSIPNIISNNARKKSTNAPTTAKTLHSDEFKISSLQTKKKQSRTAPR